MSSDSSSGGGSFCWCCRNDDTFPGSIVFVIAFADADVVAAVIVFDINADGVLIDDGARFCCCCCCWGVVVAVVVFVVFEFVVVVVVVVFLIKDCFCDCINGENDFDNSVLAAATAVYTAVLAAAVLLLPIPKYVLRNSII